MVFGSVKALEHKENEEIKQHSCHFLKQRAVSRELKPVWLYMPGGVGGRLPAGQASAQRGTPSHASYKKVSEPAPQRLLGWICLGAVQAGP